MWTSFVGFMGCGKSTVTRLLQAATSRPLVASDDLVIERSRQFHPGDLRPGRRTGLPAAGAGGAAGAGSRTQPGGRHRGRGGGDAGGRGAAAQPRRGDLDRRALGGAAPPPAGPGRRHPAPGRSGWAGPAWRPCTGGGGGSTPRRRISACARGRGRPTRWPAPPCCAACSGSGGARRSGDEGHRRQLAGPTLDRARRARRCGRPPTGSRRRSSTSWATWCRAPRSWTCAAGPAGWASRP